MIPQAFRFDPVESPPAAKALRREFREFLDENRASLGNRRECDGRARLDRHDMTEAVWRTRKHGLRALRRAWRSVVLHRHERAGLRL
jgi:hypothetical protein